MAEKEKVTVGGIEVEYYPAVLTSPKFGMGIGDMADPDLPESEKTVVQARVMRMLFGDGRYRLFDDLEGAGVEFGDWLTEFFEAVGAKNS